MIKDEQLIKALDLLESQYDKNLDASAEVTNRDDNFIYVEVKFNDDSSEDLKICAKTFEIID